MKYSMLSPEIKKQLNQLETPFFLFDLDIVSNNLQKINELLKPDRVYYAVKCNSLPQILQTLHKTECSFEVNNLAELEKVISCGAKPKDLINSSPITPAGDVAAMFAKGVRHFVYDSKEHIDNLGHNAPGSYVTLRIYTTNKGSEFELSKRLGADIADAVSLIQYAQKSGLKPYGLTFHVGSQCTNPDNWRIGIYECGKIFDRFPALEMINIGGGFPVKYNGYVPNIESIADVINKAIATYFKNRPKIALEPGRFIVGNAAMTATTATMVNHAPHLSRAIVDISAFVGFIEVIESGNKFHYSVETDADGEMKSYRIGGATCAGTDIILDEVMLPELKVDFKTNNNGNSRLYFLNTGAYTTEYFPQKAGNGFNGAKIPKIYYMAGKNII